jgi:hypothetical protein
MPKTLLVSLLWPAIAICQTAPALVAAPLVTRYRQCQEILEKALQDKNPDTRKQAAIALRLVGSTDPFPSQLESLLDDKGFEVRRSAVASLADLKTGGTIAARSLWALAALGERQKYAEASPAPSQKVNTEATLVATTQEAVP